MSLQAAGLVLAWLAIVVLAFGMAGTLALVRRLEAALVASDARASRGSGLTGAPSRAEAVRRLVPTARPFALVLLVTPECPACRDALPGFERLARSHQERAEFRVLSSASYPGSDSREDGLDVEVDAILHAALSPGYFPALVVVDAEGNLVDVGPGGDLVTVERWIDKQARHTQGSRR